MQGAEVVFNHLSKPDPSFMVTAALESTVKGTQEWIISLNDPLITGFGCNCRLCVDNKYVMVMTMMMTMKMTMMRTIMMMMMHDDDDNDIDDNDETLNNYT